MTNQDNANVVSTMNRVGRQDSASAPTPHHPHPCPYRMEIWYRIEGQQDSANVVSTMNRVGHQDSASVLAMYRVGHQDSASAPTTRHPHPCPYRMEIWHPIIGGTPLPANQSVSEREA